MNLLEYEVLDPELRGEAGQEFRRLKASSAESLMEALEGFVLSGGRDGTRVAPELRDGQVEIYAIPPPIDLREPPVPLALVRLCHRPKTIELVAIMREFEPRDGRPWEQVVALGLSLMIEI